MDDVPAAHVGGALLNVRVSGRRRPWVVAGTALLLAADRTAAQSTGVPGGMRGSDERGALRLGGGDDVQLTLGGYVQVDGRWISGARSRQPDGLLLRRARLVFDAALANGWQLRLQPDFGQGRVQVQDAFAGRETERTTVRVGRFRPAFGTERMQSSSTLLAPERGIVNSLMPSRSFGAQVVFTRAGWRVAAGGFRTPIGTDVAPVDTDGDIDAVAGSGHDLLLRVARDVTWANGFAELQVGVLTGRERGSAESPALSRILSVSQQPLLVFRDDGSEVGTVRAAGSRTRGSAGARLASGSTVAAVEAAWLRQRVGRGGAEYAPTVGAVAGRVARAWNAERTRTQEVIPRSPRGAVEVGVRGGFIGAWGDSLPTLLSRASVTHAHTGGIAVSWLPTALTRLTMAYDITRRRQPTAPQEHALLVRWQQGF